MSSVKILRGGVSIGHQVTEEWKWSVFTFRYSKSYQKIVEYQIPKKYIKHGHAA